jgi:hypothetical protein
MLAFDPISLAVVASVFEHACLTEPRRLAPRAHVWLRRHSKSVFGSLVQESSNPALDAINHIDARLAVIVMVIMALRLLVHMKITSRFVSENRAYQQPLWNIVAMYIHWLSGLDDFFF